MQRVESFGVGCLKCGLDSWVVDEGSSVPGDGQPHGVTCSGCGTRADVQVTPEGSTEDSVTEDSV